MLKAAMACVSQRLAVKEGLVEAFIEAFMLALLEKAAIKWVKPIK